MRSTVTAEHAEQDVVARREAGPRRARSAVRYGVLALLTLGIAVNYLDRSATSVALPSINAELHIGSVAKGVLLSCFFWTYTLFQVPGGLLVDRFGSRLLLGVGSVLWGLATAASGAARGLGVLVGLRAVMGVTEAPSYSGASASVKQWFPKGERAFASGTFNVGSKIGGTLAVRWSLS